MTLENFSPDGHVVFDKPQFFNVVSQTDLRTPPTSFEFSVVSENIVNQVMVYNPYEHNADPDKAISRDLALTTLNKLIDSDHKLLATQAEYINVGIIKREGISHTALTLINSRTHFMARVYWDVVEATFKRDI